MSERFQAYLERLEALSTEELDRSAGELALREKEHMAQVIAHIAEISRRRGELERGYKNLFDYCLRRLHLSEGSVALRIQVANVACRFPEVLAFLSEGKITLSVAGRLAPHLREENWARLLSDCAGMTKREVEEYLVALCPRPLFEPSIRRLPSGGEGREKREGSTEGATPSEARASPEEREGREEKRPEGSTPGEGAPQAPPFPVELLEAARPDIYNFRFAAGRGFREKLVRLAEVLGVEDPERNIASLLEGALDLALERKDPRRRQERRLARERRREAARAAEPRPDEVLEEREAKEETSALPGGSPEAEAKAEDPGSVPAPSRYIPLPVRGRVLEKAGYRCEFTGPDGTRCTSRTGLEIEHERPFAISRSHDERYLRAFCKRHNLLSAERAYGREFIRGKIEEKGRRKAAAPL